MAEKNLNEDEIFVAIPRFVSQSRLALEDTRVLSEMGFAAYDRKYIRDEQRVPRAIRVDTRTE